MLNDFDIQKQLEELDAAIETGLFASRKAAMKESFVHGCLCACKLHQTLGTSDNEKELLKMIIETMNIILKSPLFDKRCAQ